MHPEAVLSLGTCSHSPLYLSWLNGLKSQGQEKGSTSFFLPWLIAGMGTKGTVWTVLHKGPSSSVDGNIKHRLRLCVYLHEEGNSLLGGLENHRFSCNNIQLLFPWALDLWWFLYNPDLHKQHCQL